MTMCFHLLCEPLGAEWLGDTVGSTSEETGFRRGCTTLQSHPQGGKVPKAPHLIIIAPWLFECVELTVFFIIMIYLSFFICSVGNWDSEVRKGILDY